MIRDIDFPQKVQLPEYDDLLLNNDMIELARIRDKYNRAWYKKTEEVTGSFGSGTSWGVSHRIFNTLIITSSHSTGVPAPKNPKTIERSKYFDRITILRKVKGNWYIVKDVIDYENNDIGLKQLLDKNYVRNQINEYVEWYENIDNIAQEYLSNKKWKT